MRYNGVGETRSNEGFVASVSSINVRKTVVHALTADGWTITDDPLKIGYGGTDLFVDLGAERTTIAVVFDEQTEQDQMDKLVRYREIVRGVIEEYASYKLSHGQIETEAIVDPIHDHYEVMQGWDGVRRIHGAVVHVDIRNGKVWIQYDGTNRPVADELIAAGIPQENIVLAWHPAELRHHTGFATG